MKKNIWLIGFIVIFVGALLAMWLARSNSAIPSPSSNAKEKVDFVIGSDDHVIGAQNAKVTLVEFGDFQCPACRAYDPILNQVLKDNQNDLRIVYRNFPLLQIHLRAQASAQAAGAAAKQGRFWEMLGLLFEKQDEWPSHTGTADFENYAGELGLNIEQFKSDYNSQEVKDKIARDLKYGVELGINSTPTFYLNGKKISPNPRNVQEFNDLIKQALISQ